MGYLHLSVKTKVRFLAKKLRRFLAPLIPPNVCVSTAMCVHMPGSPLHQIYWRFFCDIIYLIFPLYLLLCSPVIGNNQIWRRIAEKAHWWFGFASFKQTWQDMSANTGASTQFTQNLPHSLLRSRLKKKSSWSPNSTVLHLDNYLFFVV